VESRKNGRGVAVVSPEPVLSALVRRGVVFPKRRREDRHHEGLQNRTQAEATNMPGAKGPPWRDEASPPLWS
jgi:hypothetical protein